MRFIILLLLISFAVQAQEKARKPSHLLTEPPRKPTHLQTMPAPYSFSEGTVNGKALRMESSRTGGTTLSTGSLGKRPVNTLTVRLDTTELTTGTVGNESIEIITITPDKD
jgi:hypothetical protein